MKHLTKVLPVLGLVATVSYVGEAAAEFTGNAAATTDYVWRGTTQNDGEAAVQGGLDYSLPLGVYVGAWVSNSAFGSYELDLYGGYAFELGPVSVDVGYIGYLYPQAKDQLDTPDEDESDIEYNEGYIGFGFGVGKTSWLVQASYSSDVFATGEDSLYLELGLDVPIKDDLTLGFHVGNYDFDGDDPTDPSKTFAGFEDYTDYSVSLTKGDFTFTWSDTDLKSDAAKGLDFDADEDAKIFVTWSKEWDLLK